MAFLERQAWYNKLQAIFDNGGGATAAEFREVMIDLRDSATFWDKENRPANTMLLIDGNGDLVDANVRQMTDGTYLFGNDVQIPSASLKVEDLITLSEATGFLTIRNNVTQHRFQVLDARYDELVGSYRPNQYFLQPYDEQKDLVVLQQEIDTQITTNPISIPYTTTLEAQTNYVRVQAFERMTNVRVRVIDAVTGIPFKYVPNRFVWEEQQGGITIEAGMHEIDLTETPFRLSPGRALNIEIQADNIALLGNNANVPYFAIRKQDGEFRNLAYLNDFNQQQIYNVVKDIIQQGANTTVTLDDNTNTITIASATPSTITPRTNEEIIDTIAGALRQGNNVTIVHDDPNDTITISASVTPTPDPGPDALYYGLMNTNTPDSVALNTLTTLDPTNPQTVSTGLTTAGQFFVILVPITHDITSIRDTVLQQDVTNIFTKTENVRSISSQNYDSYVIGPLNAGVNEEYVLTF